MPTQVTFDDIVRFFRAERMEFAIGKENRLLLTLMGKNTSLTAQVSFIREKEVIGLHAIFPFPVPTDKISAALELAARINWGLLLAVCEVNPDTGAIRFRSTMLVDDAAFNRAQFSTMLATVCSLADRYAPAFQKVIEGKSIHEALVGIEE